MLLQHEEDFLKLCLEYGVLQFGDFTLKSGRQSPYFFNLGKISDGPGMHRLCECYAAAIMSSSFKSNTNSNSVDFDFLFGPAYKGIPLVTGVGMILHSKYGINVPFAYNRKEKKDHGEGGMLVGAVNSKNDSVKKGGVKSRIFLLDDVMTAGSAIRECREIIGREWPEGMVAGVMVALDREERLSESDPRSSIQAVKEDFGIPVLSIVSFSKVLDFLQRNQNNNNQISTATITAMTEYRAKYGSSYVE